VKFPVFKEARETISTIQEVIRYLTAELSQSLRELRTGLDLLSFNENFESFTATLDINASSEVFIRNQFQRGRPSQWFLVDANGDSNIVRGDEPWTDEFLYLKNVGSNNATVTVMFLK